MFWKVDIWIGKQIYFISPQILHSCIFFMSLAAGSEKYLLGRRSRCGSVFTIFKRVNIRNEGELTFFRKVSLTLKMPNKIVFICVVLGLYGNCCISACPKVPPTVWEWICIFIHPVCCFCSVNYNCLMENKNSSDNQQLLDCLIHCLSISNGSHIHTMFLTVFWGFLMFRPVD